MQLEKVFYIVLLTSSGILGILWWSGVGDENS